MSDLYAVLGLAPGASAAEIRQAYLRLAKERHPDRFVDPAEKAAAGEFFARLTEAFNTLGNDRKRAEYDALRERPVPVGPEQMAADAYERGLRCYEARQYHEAAELLRAAVAFDGGQARYHLALGRALLRNPQWAREAADSFDQALRLDPRLAEAYAEQARLLLDKGLKLRARRVLEAGLKAVPGSRALLALLEQTGDEPPPGDGPSGLLDRFRRR